MSNSPYANFVLSAEIENQYNSMLNLQQFCIIDNSLTGTAGMIRKINRYKATDGTQELGIGEGNDKSIEVSHTPTDYKIKLAQNKFEYFDEEELTDPTLVATGITHLATDMFNFVNKDIYNEFLKTTLTVNASAFDFGVFVDAVSKLNIEVPETLEIFGFVSPDDMGKIRKALKDDLKYVEAYVRSGYIGTVAGVHLYTKKDATVGTVVIATKKAVTIFNKIGMEVEQPARDSDDANIRKNTIIARKYYLVALTDERSAVKIVVS